MNFTIPSSALLLIILLTSCTDSRQRQPELHFPAPAYGLLDIVPVADTLRFPLDEDSFGNLEAWSIRQHRGETRITFFDQRSGSLIEYQYPSCRQVHKISLRDMFAKSYIHTAYLHNYDSLFVVTSNSFYLLDSSLHVHRKIPHEVDDFRQRPEISPLHPPFIQNGKLYFSRYPGMDNTSLASVKCWQVLWESNTEARLPGGAYHLPATYTENYYASRFFYYNFCINDSGRLVLSFPADTMVYETDLKSLHKAWFAKSQYQFKPAHPSSKDSISFKKTVLKDFYHSDSYAGIYFDACHKRYLRIVRSGISDEEMAQQKKSEFRLLIMDHAFRIIGESAIPLEITLKEILTTPDGKIFARIAPTHEEALMFVRLAYKEHQIARKYE